MPRIPLYLKVLLLVLITIGQACDTLEEDAAPANEAGDYAGGSILYATPGTITVINLLDRVPPATSAYSIKITSQPMRGEATIDEQGLLLYKQNHPYTEGNDFLGYAISQNGKTIIAETLTIVVSTDTASFPCLSGALSDSISVLANTDNNLLPVLQNDNICTGFKNTVKVISAPKGNIYWNGSEFVYKPITGFLGEDHFIYQLCQSDGQSAAPICSYGFVSLYIVNEFPCRVTAVEDLLTLEYHGSDTLYQLNVLANDNQCGVAGLRPILEEQRKNIAEANGFITYFITDTTFLQMDSLRYKLCQDGSCTSARVLLSIEKK